ncbi:hypothetical protein RO3G_00813 [Lichtheimia corymbifera JMRC:FSU:9682]|uniref:Uncharacterized protein n=1 Tax=Lichtheimia corymbifera JMRC:FSU:9682 TaxID=1263082 RepID=A0A068RSF2_9FUNG|nr:hypothetical protein RO3G_00813 [Lichtheimia corymbifera JMRC:FSU:9682]
MATTECHSMPTTNKQRPIPHAVLKVQFKRLVSQHNQGGVIFTRDLLTVMDEFEREHDVVLLTLDQKTAIQPYCNANPDLEMTAEDILNLLKVMFPNNSTSEEIYAARPRTSAPLADNYRRPSLYEDDSNDDHDDDNEPVDKALNNEDTMHMDHREKDNQNTKPMNQDAIISGEEQEEEHVNVAQYYRRSLQLTRRLKASERSVASMTRDNEDRITQLQNRVDDMTQEVVKQKREILEYKNKEKSSLDQIGALEAHIARIERSETDQKQIYLSIKRLFEEKCQEAQELQDMLRHKELELQKTEALLSAINHEFKHLNEERNRLMELQNSLERELVSSQQTHMQLEEQRTENERLKDIIDSLKLDIESRNDLHPDGAVPDLTKPPSPANTLHSELEGQLEETPVDAEERLKSVENEKDYYKTQASVAMEDLDRVNQELAQLKRALDLENESLVSELAHLRTRFPERQDDVEELDISTSTYTDEPFAIQIPAVKSSETDTAIDMGDVWAQSRLRKRKMTGKRRTIQDLNESTAHAVAAMIASPSSPSFNEHHQALVRPNDRAVTNTATFALYTLLVYIFGIVTSTFLLDGHPGSWEQALVAVASQQGGSRSKILEIILYWIEKLLEGNAIPLS